MEICECEKCATVQCAYCEAVIPNDGHDVCTQCDEEQFERPDREEAAT